MVGKVTLRKNKFGQETAGLHCGILVPLAILIISKVIREETVMGHHNKKTHAREWLICDRLLRCQILAWLEEASVTLPVWKYKQLNLCSLLGVKDSFTQLSDHCNLAESFLIRVSLGLVKVPGWKRGAMLLQGVRFFFFLLPPLTNPIHEK